jgi:hypothetical protein
MKYKVTINATIPISVVVNPENDNATIAQLKHLAEKEVNLFLGETNFELMQDYGLTENMEVSEIVELTITNIAEFES